MAKDQAVGSEHVDEFRPGFHDRLARNWPEPREQLHTGGWSETRWMVRELGIGPGDVVLDVCCGEGGTAIWIARVFRVHVSGVDIVRPAIEAAQSCAQRHDAKALCTFTWGNLYSLPYEDESFDVVLGQDPDGFAHAQRVVAFKECFRVLRPGGRFGIQHWIPGPGAPRALVEEFDRANVQVGYPSHGEVHADAYILAMQEALFQDIRVVDKSSVYRKHMLAIRERAQQRNEEVDLWTATWLELSKQHPFGVALFARKPD